MSIENRAAQYGEIFGQWRIDGYIGSGSGGKTGVFRIVRSNDDNSSEKEERALKVVTVIEEDGRQAEYSKEYLERYKKRRDELCEIAKGEVRRMYELEGGSNIVYYLDYYERDWQEDTRFGRDLLIRMPLLGVLEKEMKTRDVYPEVEIVRIGKEIATALVQCHEKGILHRDIKPANIFITKQSNYQLGDFGIARIVDAANRASTGIGSKPYAAPEQASGTYDKRVDIYSLGLVLYELSNGYRLPFASSQYVTEEEIRMRTMGQPLPAPSNASPALAQVILKACAYEPRDRYQTAQEFFDELNGLTYEKPLHASGRSKPITEGNLAPVEQAQRDLYVTQPAAPEGQIYSAEFPELSEESPAISEKKETHENDSVQEIGEFPERLELEDAEKLEKLLENAEKLFDLGESHYISDDYTEAFKWLSKAAKSLSNVEKNAGQFDFDWVKLEAEIYLGQTLCYLGNCYVDGKGVEQDYDEALRCYQKAIEKKVSWGHACLGDCYFTGRGVQQNFAEAVKCYQIAANNEDPYGEYGLGNCYYYGRGCRQDYAEAVRWYQKSVEDGDVDAAKKMLGDCYYYGRGVEQDYSKAVECYEDAECLFPAAKCSLGDCYYYGHGVGKDYYRAAELYHASAKQGYSEAKRKLKNCYQKLGDCYRYGKGVKQDSIRADYWYEKAQVIDTEAGDKSTSQQEMSEGREQQRTDKDETDVKHRTTKSNEKPCQCKKGIDTEIDPWHQIEEKYPIESIVTGVVEMVLPRHISVELEKGVSGLVAKENLPIHITDAPSQHYSIGQKISVKVLSIDKNKCAINLTAVDNYRYRSPFSHSKDNKHLDDSTKDPWLQVVEKYPVGSVVCGTVVKTEEYFLSVELEKGVIGYAHEVNIPENKRASHSRSIKSVSNKMKFRIGEKVKVTILEVNQDRRQIKLSMKDV